MTRLKISRILDTYGLTELGGELERRWTSSGEDAMSLRELAEFVNLRIVQSAVDEVDRTLYGNPSTIYHALMSDDVTSGERVQMEMMLEQAGIDVDRLRRDFVSHQAVHSYLTKARGVNSAAAEASRDVVANRERDIQQLRGRLVTVTNRTLESLKNTGKIDLGSFEVIASVQVFCEDCESQFDVGELFSRGGCLCEPADHDG